MTEKKLRALEQKCYDAEQALNERLATLARAAEGVLGFEVVADLCNGSEIEFREVDAFGNTDADSAIYMEDIIEKLKK